MFDQLKQLNDLRKQSQKMEKELSGEVLEISHKGVVVQVSANMQVVMLASNGKDDEVVLEAINKGLKEAQKEAAKRMRSQLGDLGLNIPGM